MIKSPILYKIELLAAELGFEPRQTESESVVLPLHNSALYSIGRFLSRNGIIITERDDFVNMFVEIILTNLTAFYSAIFRHFDSPHESFRRNGEI